MENRAKILTPSIDPFKFARRKMVERHLTARGITDQRVIKAMLTVPRHLFVEEALQDQAYSDYPLGIGAGQTISQPYIVALMSQSLELTGHEKILEIGTGCGYQTAVLSGLVQQIYTIERIKQLGLLARRNLKGLGLRNIVLRVGDGSCGWPEKGPYDGILIAAGAPEVPQPLLSQLSEGGKLLIPVGDVDNQDLMRITRKGDQFIKENLGKCRFVKLVGRHAWYRAAHAGERIAKRSLV